MLKENSLSEIYRYIILNTFLKDKLTAPDISKEFDIAIGRAQKLNKTVKKVFTEHIDIENENNPELTSLYDYKEFLAAYKKFFINGDDKLNYFDFNSFNLTPISYGYNEFVSLYKSYNNYEDESYLEIVYLLKYDGKFINDFPMKDKDFEFRYDLNSYLLSTSIELKDNETAIVRLEHSGIYSVNRGILASKILKLMGGISTIIKKELLPSVKNIHFTASRRESIDDGISYSNENIILGKEYTFVELVDKIESELSQQFGTKVSVDFDSHSYIPVVSFK